MPRAAPRGRPVAGALVACLVALSTAEVLFRVGLYSGWTSLHLATRLAALLGNEYHDDEMHRVLLQLKFLDSGHDGTFPTFDPLLGWTARPRTPENPFGILYDEPYSLAEARRWKAMLFFGDSFTAGVTKPAGAIPQQLGRLLPEWQVLNFGVPGYGLDQIYLLLRAVVGEFDHPRVIVGLFYNDLDRLIFEVQASVKPWFTVENETLVEHGVPIPSQAGAWLATHAPRTRLYSVRAAGGLLDDLFAHPWVAERYFWLHPSETAPRRAEKQALARLLVRAIKAECERRGLQLSFVLFPYREHVIQDGWYERFMHELLEHEHVAYLDLQEPLQRWMAERGLRWTDLYASFAHPSAEENAFLAGEIAVFLRGTGRP